jgi:hypothetical protein
VRELLEQAGFGPAQECGLVLRASQHAVLVGWQPSQQLLLLATKLHGSDPGFDLDSPYTGVQQAMVTALRATLEQAGFTVTTTDVGLRVAWPGPGVPTT